MPFSKPTRDPWYQDVDYNIEMNRIRHRVDHLEKQNIKLMDHIVFLKKNGYTYDQLNSRMLLCDRCHKDLRIEDDTDRGTTQKA